MTSAETVFLLPFLSICLFISFACPILIRNSSTLLNRSSDMETETRTEKKTETMQETEENFNQYCSKCFK